MARELEYKYLCDGVPFVDVVIFLKQLLKGERKFEQGSYVNSYFKTSGEARVMRFTTCSDGGGELTVKVADKGNTVDRKEWNLHIDNTKVGDTLEMLEAALGEPISVIFQFAEWYVDDVIVSVVQSPDKPQWVFLEVEAKDMQTLNAWDSNLQRIHALNLKPVKNSIYSIFVNHEGVKF